MTELEIRNQIAYYEARIKEQKQIIRKQEDACEELQMLRDRIELQRLRFEDRQQTRKRNLLKVQMMTARVKTAQGYYEGMGTLLSGKEQNEALSNFEGAKGAVKRKQADCLERIDEAKGIVKRYESIVNSLQWQLYRLRMQSSVD